MPRYRPGLEILDPGIVALSNLSFREAARRILRTHTPRPGFQGGMVEGCVELAANLELGAPGTEEQ